METVIVALIAGLGIGAVYALVALSYNVIYTATGIFNTAQGDLMIFGVLIAYFGLKVWNVNQLAALLAVVVAVVLVSLVEERIAVRPFMKQNAPAGIGWFISTLGFGMVIQAVAVHLYGPNPPETIPSFIHARSMQVFGLGLGPRFVAAFLTALVMVVALEFYYSRTWMGLVMRGVAADREVAALRGVDIATVSRTAFALAGVVTGIAAFVVAPIISADLSLGLAYSLKGFIALAVGGFGSLRGSLFGGLILGVGEQAFDLWVSPRFEILAGLILLLLVLLVRPNGLFGQRSARLV